MIVLGGSSIYNEMVVIVHRRLNNEKERCLPKEAFDWLCCSDRVSLAQIAPFSATQASREDFACTFEFLVGCDAFKHLANFGSDVPFYLITSRLNGRLRLNFQLFLILS